MPTIHRINAIKISINPNDHNPPHVHIAMPGPIFVTLNIRTREIVDGYARPAQLREVREWMEANEEYILNEWRNQAR